LTTCSMWKEGRLTSSVDDSSFAELESSVFQHPNCPSRVTFCTIPTQRSSQEEGSFYGCMHRSSKSCKGYNHLGWRREREGNVGFG
jgi:hypothetical protein